MRPQLLARITYLPDRGILIPLFPLAALAYVDKSPCSSPYNSLLLP
ncbi:MAG: hypothetical protein ACI9K5_003025 [Gammaproteobacteria bacterium]|jgi:hypothetical protein